METKVDNKTEPQHDAKLPVRRLVCMNLSNTCSSKNGVECKMTGAKCVFQSIQTNA